MSVLIKIFAVALALSQVTTKPDVKTEFDPVRDQAEAIQLLRDGCNHMLKVFDLENINIDELITIAMNDPQAVTSEARRSAASTSKIWRTPTAKYARARLPRSRWSVSVSPRST
jgi:hypothetical protein